MSSIIKTAMLSTISSSVLKDLNRAVADTFTINLSNANSKGFSDYFNRVEYIDIFTNLGTQGSQIRVKHYTKTSDLKLGEEFLKQTI